MECIFSERPSDQLPDTFIHSFNHLSDIVRAATLGCPNWVTTLLGWKKDGERSGVEM
jgi:hypothetical protein